MAATYKGYSKLAEKLARVTHFTCEETDCLLNMYDTVAGGCRLDANRFRDVMHAVFGMTDDVMLEYIFQVFDADRDGSVGPEEFVCKMSVFLRGTLPELVDYCYSVYDHNRDGGVSREEMMQLLRPHVVTLPPGEERDEVAKDLLDLAVKKLDEDHDGRVSREDYTAAVTREPLLLEALGACLPETRARDEFLATFMEKYGRKLQQPI
ncbi:EF-hand calcium-binding domain-containing protein 1 [Hyalella azteca]|uniref:EF-hand calcium-binding domain-containing protein 1 n=1 Tax=Hyalella azteca TaxID=294128 RepID=A0A8B7PGE5_HYAAZ|nr:EF-hand calcium-binding domain-containing protein 1 [Hyalella azteca]